MKDLITSLSHTIDIICIILLIITMIFSNSKICNIFVLSLFSFSSITNHILQYIIQRYENGDNKNG